MANNVPGVQGTFSKSVDSLYRKLWSARLIDVSEQEHAYMQAAGKLKDRLRVARQYIGELKKGLKIRDEIQSDSDEVVRLKEGIKTAEM